MPGAGEDLQALFNPVFRLGDQRTIDMSRVGYRRLAERIALELQIQVFQLEPAAAW